MIISKLTGGLGNQMFQYAAGRRFAEKHHTEFKLDLSFFNQKFDKNTTPRSYALNIFNTIQTAATPWEINKFYPQSKNRFINRVLQKMSTLRFINTHCYIEKHFHYDPQVLQLPDQTLLNGYFQCEKYFIDIKNILLKEFTLKNPLPKKTKEMINQIKTTESVSIHVRRKDYVTNKTANRFHGMCEPEYYQKAVKIMEQKVKNPHFYIFSDDTTWVKENIRLPETITYMADHINKDYMELLLMAKCMHNIIANSSFSWWGAWLNNNPAKIVISPENWFKDPGINTNDLIPHGWTRI